MFYETKITIYFAKVGEDGSRFTISSSFLVILAISISVIVLITIVFAVTVYSIPDKETTRISLSCHDRILGYAQMGFYIDSKTVQAALASCSGSPLAM
jgi:hypothetical protein